jgi:hypothetical protein
MVATTVAAGEADGTIKMMGDIGDAPAVVGPVSATARADGFVRAVVGTGAALSDFARTRTVITIRDVANASARPVAAGQNTHRLLRSEGLGWNGCEGLESNAVAVILGASWDTAG